MKGIIVRFFINLMLLSVTIGCSTSNKIVKQKKCPRLYHSNYTKILDEEYKTILNNDTISYNEIRFECVISAMLMHKVMYDKFGMWDEEVYPVNKKHPVVMWKKIDLFSNGKKYDIYTNGNEGKENIYASVMVFDEADNDLLAKGSIEKEKLTNYFSELIKSNKTNKKDFYEIYWKKVDPAHWEMIKTLRKISN